MSRYWEVKYRQNGILSFWPKSFYQEYYHDDLLEGVPDVVNDFRRVRALIEAEANSEPLDESSQNDG